MNFKIISESTTRFYLLNNLFKYFLITLKNYFKDENIFIIADEIEIKGV
jgi:hypothetical protein